MKAIIRKSSASGELYAPTSKSMAHRILISAAMADGVSTVSGITPCEDVLATVDCLRALGARIESDGNTYTVFGRDMRSAVPTGVLNARESGSTLRFMIPIAALSGAAIEICGAERLMQRPMTVYEELFSERGLSFVGNERSISLRGPLKADTFTVRGDISSQFISGLLFALPVLDTDSIIRIIPPFESRSYIDLTVLALKKFGINVFFEDSLTIRIPGNQKYLPGDFTVEGDYSAAAFIDALNLIGSDIKVLGLEDGSAQGDKIYRKLYPLLLNSAPEIDIQDCPDLGPILFTLASYLGGATFTGTARLRIKESDRAAVMAEELKKFGADIEVRENSVTVRKTELHASDEPLSGHNDHRVVMSLAVLLTKFGGEIEGAEAVSKSYPDFFEDITSVGIEVTLND